MMQENTEFVDDIDITSPSLADVNLEQAAMFTDARDGESGMIVEFVSRLSEGFLNAATLVTSLDTMPAFHETTDGMTDEKRANAREKILDFLRKCIRSEINDQKILKTRQEMKEAIVNRGKHPQNVSINMHRLKAQMLRERGSLHNSEEQEESVDTLIRVLKELQEEAGSRSDAAFIVQEIYGRLMDENIKDLDEVMTLLIELMSTMATNIVLHPEEVFQRADSIEKKLLTTRLHALFAATLSSMIHKPN